MAEEMKNNPFAAFDETAMSFDEAQAKVKAESRVKTSYFRFTDDGDYNFRVLPLAPVNVDGKWVLDRKGYEYPLTSYMVGFPTETKGKFNYVTIIDPRQVFPDVQGDIFRAYYDLAVAELGDDKKAIDSLGNVISKGGASIRPSFGHCVYVIDQDNKKDGIQLLQLNNAQYKDLETTKMATWKDLLKRDKNAQCPISSLAHGYDITATKDSNSKPSVKFTIGRFESPVDDKIAAELLEKERIPDVIYRYTRFHLEATVEYLKLIDERYGFDFMEIDESNGEFKNQAINDIYQQIKLSIPADDHSHFTKGSLNADENEDGEQTANTIEDLEELVKKNADAKKDSDEFKNTKELLEGFIKNNELDFQVRRYHGLEDILEGIKDELAERGDGKAEKDDEGDGKDVDAEDRNDDTNEPAARPARARRQ